MMQCERMSDDQVLASASAEDDEALAALDRLLEQVAKLANRFVGLGLGGAGFGLEDARALAALADRFCCAAGFLPSAV